MTVTIINADCREALRRLPDESVHTCVTSPPYYGLRDYGVDGQIGLEPTPDQYVAELVDIFREVRRVLRPDGTLLLNLGDSYASRPNGSIGKEGRLDGNYTAHAEYRRAHSLRSTTLPVGLKHKDLIGIPWLVAFALRADGWWLRQENIWAKPNGMPESVNDRPARAHETVFLLSKSERYHYDAEAVRLPPVPQSVERLARSMRANLDTDTSGLVLSGGGYAPPGQPPHGKKRKTDKQRGHTRRHAGFSDRWDAMSVAQQQANGAALRSVWWIPPAQYPEAHFAVMANEIAAICILAGCPEGGVVLDPFAGAGTTGLIADRLGRDAVLIELSEEYAEMMRRRIEGDAPLFAEVCA